MRLSDFSAPLSVLVEEDFCMDKQTLSPRTASQSGRALCSVVATTTGAHVRAQVVLQSSAFSSWTYLRIPPDFPAHRSKDN